jgi:hypothetical protein
MKGFLSLELKAIFREYRHSNKISFNEIILFLLVMMSLTFIFYILKVFEINLFLILNIILILFTGLAITLKKDYFYDFIQQKKNIILKLYPQNYILLNLLKGIKFEIVFFLELSVILFFIFLSLTFSGQAIKSTIPYFIFICFWVLSIRNITLSLSSIRISSLWYYVLIFLKSIYLSGSFIILSLFIEWVTYFEGDIFQELIKFQFVEVILSGIKLLEKNIVSFPLILTTVIIFIISYLYKTGMYLLQAESKKEETDHLLIKWFSILMKRISNGDNPIFNKEFRLLSDKGILSDLLKRIYIYILTTVITIGFQHITGKDLDLNINLIYLYLTTEVVSFGLTFSKSAIGYEKKYVTIYLLSGYQLADLIVLKAKMMFMLTFLMMLPIHLCLTIIFQLHLLESISLIPIYGSFILLFSFSANYYFSYKPSFENDLAILNKYATIKTLSISTFILYLDISSMFILKTFIENPLSSLLLMIIGFLIHFSIYQVFNKKIKKGWKNFYGEYAKSIF